jgi:omega-6 fatty acid desaturase (delta-12 desaturase)
LTSLAKPIDLRTLRATVPAELFDLPRFRTLGKALFLLAVVGGILALGTAVDSLVLKVLIGFVMGIPLFALASVGHESGHGSASRNRFTNDLVGLVSMSVIGMPARGWKLKHDIHHKFGGVVGVDTDTEPGLEDYLRFGWFKRTFVRSFNRHEALMWWAIPVSLWVTTWKFAIIELVRGPMRQRVHKRWLLADMATSLVFFAGVAAYTVTFGWVNLLVLIAFPFAVSGYVSAVAFVPNHRGMPPLTEEQGRRASRFTHLNSRTVLYPSYLPGNYFMNYVPWQIEHHVFPTLPGYKLARFSPYLRDYAEKEGLPLQYETVFEAMPRMLRREWLWGNGDGKLYTYAEAEAIRRERMAATPAPAARPVSISVTAPEA